MLFAIRLSALPVLLFEQDGTAGVIRFELKN